MQVNPVIRSSEQWDEAADPLIQQVQSSSMVTVHDRHKNAA